MSATRWKTIRELFDAAYDLSPAEREALLARRCDDDELRDEVRRLLAGDEDGRQLLERAVSDVAGTLEANALDGRRVGPWRLVRELGHGGMGAVYLAERADGAFEQQVALKLIRRGMDSEQILGRFRAERQILARLKHPQIARLVDGGLTDDGQPWFAMELVEGEPIDRHCDALRLTIDERLRLFEQVCRAVAYAHSTLVVHRDLKPDNILVTASGEVRLLDFGIAKMLVDDGDGPGLTQTGLRIMTPGYASPEQVRGEPVGTATDVYSLGMILYELLTGVRPYEVEHRSPLELERVVCDTEPERPSTRVGRETAGSHDSSEVIARARRAEPRRLRKLLAGDLDVICLKALRKEPERRYGSVEALLDDIRRHLEGRPVLARPDTVGYRVRKLIARNRLAFASSLAVVLAVSALTVFYVVQLAEERDLARAEAAKAAEVSTFLRGLFEVADPSESRGESVTARELLDAGAERIATQLARQPAVQAAMMRVVGEVYQSLGLADRALPLLERSLELNRTLYGRDHEETANSALAAAAVLQDLGDMERSEPLFREVLATRERLFGRMHPQVSEALEHLAYWLETRGAIEEAEQLFREALTINRALFPADHERVVESVVKLGGILRRTDQWDEAGPLLLEGLAAQRRLYGDRHPDVASTLRNLASMRRDQGDWGGADTLYREALAIRRELYGDVHPDVANVLNSHGLLLDAMGDHAGAIAAYTEFIAMLDSIYAGPHPSEAAAHSNLASVLRAERRFAEAEAHYRQSIRVSDQVLAPDHPNRAHPLLGLAGVYADQGQHARAELLFRRALALRRGALPEGHRSIGFALDELGTSLAAMRRHAGADSALREALEIYRSSYGIDDARSQRVAWRLAELHEARGDSAAVERYRTMLREEGRDSAR